MVFFFENLTILVIFSGFYDFLTEFVWHGLLFE